MIRHIKDYGSIVLIDARYSNPLVRGGLTYWLKNRILGVDDDDHLADEIDRFTQLNLASLAENDEGLDERESDEDDEIDLEPDKLEVVEDVQPGEVEE